MHQIGAHGVAPTHVTPDIAKGVVLKKQMVFAFKEDEAVGVVGPMMRAAKSEIAGGRVDRSRIARQNGVSRDETPVKNSHSSSGLTSCARDIAY